MERGELSLNDKGRNIMKNRTQTLLFDNRKLAALLIPLALDQLLNSFMGSVDTFVVSNLGSAAISAVSLVDSINMLIVQAFFALASGGTVVCSHYPLPWFTEQGACKWRCKAAGIYYIVHVRCHNGAMPDL